MESSKSQGEAAMNLMS
jgi:hypothetical protein